jgi:hypothetical protein
MRTLIAFIFVALAAVSSVSAKEFKLYAAFLEDTRVRLSDGAEWMMDKGDVFPVKAYKNQQKNIILQLGGASFMTETARVRILKSKEVAEGLEVYKKNVRAYLESTAQKMEDDLKKTPAGTPVAEPALPEKKP